MVIVSRSKVARISQGGTIAAPPGFLLGWRDGRKRRRNGSCHLSVASAFAWTEPQSHRTECEIRRNCVAKRGGLGEAGLSGTAVQVETQRSRRTQRERGEERGEASPIQPYGTRQNDLILF